ncbi:MAG: DUF5657 family protein [Candidatus Woykebacteria bacterium]
MNLDLISQLNNISGDLVAKVDFVILLLLLFGLALYTIFAFLVLKQVRILNKSITTARGELLNTLALTHLFATLALLVTNILLLILN